MIFSNSQELIHNYSLTKLQVIALRNYLIEYRDKFNKRLEIQDIEFDEFFTHGEYPQMPVVDPPSWQVKDDNVFYIIHKLAYFDGRNDNMNVDYYHLDDTYVEYTMAMTDYVCKYITLAYGSGVDDVWYLFWGIKCTIS